MFLSLLRLVAPLICIGMILATLVAGVATPLVLAPCLAVGILTYLARKNWVAVFFGFIAALVTAYFGIWVLFAFPGMDLSGRGLATGMVLLFEWPLLGLIAAVAFIAILIQRGLKKDRQRSVV